jgi:hypothetical protein
MATFLKGNTTSFIFEKNDNEKLIKLIFEKDFVLYKHTVDAISQQIPINNLESFDENDLHYFIVPKSETHIVKWRTINLRDGQENFPFDNLNSRAIQLSLSQQSPNMIGTGRIAITTEWQDDRGDIHTATYEKDVYRILQGFIRKFSVGKVGGIFIGEDAFNLWEKNQVELCQLLQGNLTYKKDEFKKIGKK